MPLYEYRCDKCGRSFELLVRSASQQNEPKCPHCGSPRVTKAISLFGVGGGGGGSALSASCGPGPV
jgi:putative FmdB family regulatory protein